MDDYLIDDILLANTFNILTGPSGVGKTTWLMQTLTDFEAGRSILGKTSHPVPYAYISFLRDDINTARRTGFTGPLISAYDCSTFEEVLALESVQGKKLIIVDGLLSLFKGDSYSHSDTVEFCSEIAHHCANHRITVLGTINSIKDRGQRIHPAEWIDGSETWAEYAETVFTLLFQNSTQPEKGTVLHASLHNARSFAVCFNWNNNGELVEAYV